MPRKSNDRKSTPSAAVEKPAQMTEQPVRTTPEVSNQERRSPEVSNQERRSPPNHIYIGKKPVMGYAMSALIQLTQLGEIIIKARGLAISRAVDVAEIVTKRLANGAYAIKDVRIATEVVGEGEETRNVSSIEIIVGK